MARMFCDGVIKDKIIFLVILDDTMKPFMIIGQDILRLGYVLQRG